MRGRGVGRNVQCLGRVGRAGRTAANVCSQWVRGRLPAPRVDSNAQWGGIGERCNRSYARVRVYGKNPCARHAIYASARRGPLTHLMWHRLTGVDSWRAGAITGVVGWDGDMPH